MDLQKRTVIALIVSIVIVSVYSSFVSKYYHVENKGVISNIVAGASAPAPQFTPQREVKETPKLPETTRVLKKYDLDDKASFGFDSLGANLVNVQFPRYKHDANARSLISTDKWSDVQFTEVNTKTSASQMQFKHKDDSREIIKEYRFTQDGYYIEFYLTYRNLTSSPATVSYSIVSDFLPSKSSLDQGFKETAIELNDGNILRNNNIKIKKGSSLEFSQPFKWVGFRDKYFAFILSPVSAIVDSAKVSKDLDNNDIISLSRKPQIVEPGATLTDKFIYYCGTQSNDMLAKAGLGFENIRYFGKLDIFAKSLLKALVFIHKITNSWGLGIIILTILMYLCLYPLTLKQLGSMKKMQALQPEMEVLRKQHKDNPQKLNKEVMELYKKHNVNPLGGCLPIVLQIPVFFALFQALNRGIELKGAHFLWIKDLSEPDKLMIIGTTNINLLPILMLVAMFFQQKMSMASMASAQAEQQKMMLWLTPIMFGFIFYNMPSGLVLYWFVNSLLMIFSQWKVLK
jgi:YidC/Oxa1 family membrane protein insertase